MKDRVPLYPGRVKLTPVAGQENTYDMTRADQPTQEGTPLNKASLLADATAALFGLGDNAVPDNVFSWIGKYNQHWWRRRKYPEISAGDEITLSANGTKVPDEDIKRVAFGLHASTSNAYTLTYGTELSVDINGNLSIENPQIFSYSYNSVNTSPEDFNVLRGCYYTSFDGTILKVTDEATPQRGKAQSTTHYCVWMSPVISMKAESVDVTGEYLQSPDRSAYPDSGEQDGYEYEYLGIPFNNAVSAPKIETGSYVGTGKYGADNPNSLTFKSLPKKVSIVGAHINSSIHSGYGQHYNEAVFYCEEISGFYTQSGYGYLNYGGYQSIGGSSYFSKISGSTLSWYNTDDTENQFNEKSVKYYYFAIL